MPSWSGSSVLDAWGDPDDECNFDYANVDATAAGEELFEMLVSLKLEGNISAKQCCVLAFWAHKAGACGDVSNLQLRPDQQSGQYSHRFDKVATGSPRDQNHYFVKLGRRLRHDASRAFTPIATQPIHEALAQQMMADKDASLVEALRSARAKGELPPLYTEHPVVAAAPPGADVHPVCVYVGATSFGRQDSVLAFWAYFMLSEKRHLIAVIRKSEMCACGCRGWCSLYPLWSSVSWSLSALVDGVYPQQRHDNEAWGDADASRASLAGLPLGFRGICVFLKGGGLNIAMPWASPNGTICTHLALSALLQRKTCFRCVG